MMKHTILVATTNPGKLRELNELLDDVAVHIHWVCLRDFPGIPPVKEDGESFAQNACKKALGYAKATGLWTLADDSGLVVDALKGEPGIYSARYAIEECDTSDPKSIDVANYNKLLRKLHGIPDPQRTARFVCHLCLASSKKILLETSGTVDGRINHKPVGENGFGYDPVFYIPQLNCTAAQLESGQKNLISHRASAIRKLKPELKRLLSL
jgi:XTP/dITP diphosphohydrolase